MAWQARSRIAVESARPVDPYLDPYFLKYTAFHSTESFAFGGVGEPDGLAPGRLATERDLVASVSSPSSM